MNARDGRIPRFWAIGIVGAIALIGAGTLALYNAHGDAQANPSESPVAALSSGESALPSAPTSSPSASPERTGTPGPGTLKLDFGELGSASVSIQCLWRDSQTVAWIRFGSEKMTVFGESVTPALVDGIQPGYPVLVLEREGAPRYYSNDDIMGNLYVMETELQLDSTASEEPGRPFAGQDPTEPLDVYVSITCGWPPAGVPVAALDPNYAKELTRGTVTLAINSTGESVSGPLECQWVSKSKIVYYTPLLPLSIAGERVWPVVWGPDIRPQPYLTLRREGRVADYDSDAGTLDTGGWGTSQWTLRFSGLTPDPNTYPDHFDYPGGRPLPTGLDWYTTPLGGNEANRNLSGSLAWDCGAPPAGAPEVEPTYEPEPSGPGPFPTVDVTVSGTTAHPVANWCFSGIEVTDPSRDPGDWDCTEDAQRWGVPDEALQATAGAELSFSITGWRLQSVDMTIATTSEVERWRGGQPDTAVQVQHSSFSAGVAIFPAPKAGDWTALFHVVAKNSYGDKVDAIYLLRMKLTE